MLITDGVNEFQQWFTNFILINIKSASINKHGLKFLPQGENATLHYILVGANDKFDIRSSGQIVVKANIDREEKSQYKFVVTAQETLTPERHENNVTIIINITDVNDHNPRCSQEIYKVTVDENRPNGTFVVEVLNACY